MTPPADGDRGKRSGGGSKRPGGRKGGKPAGTSGGGNAGGADIEALSPDAFARALVRRMEACPDAERLNDQVMQPFIAALEDVCRARGYVLNIYGDTANLVFSGDEEDAETIYQLVEAYLDGKTDDSG